MLTDQVDGLHYSEEEREMFLPAPSAQRTEAIEQIHVLGAKRGTRR